MIKDQIKELTEIINNINKENHINEVDIIKLSSTCNRMLLDHFRYQQRDLATSEIYKNAISLNVAISLYFADSYENLLDSIL